MAFVVSHLPSQNKGLLRRKGAPKHNILTKVLCFKKACRRYVGWQRNHRKERFKGYKTGGKLPVGPAEEPAIREESVPATAAPENRLPVAPLITSAPDTAVAPDRLIILDEVLFDINSARLNSGFTFRLDSLIKILVKDATLHVAVSGHTDNVGTEEYNRTLSSDRARAVANYLIENRISKSRIAYSGEGSTRPIMSNDTREGRKKNRRVEIIISEER
jgi:outer membrane protein OmpA-like peptidoglycan-associated protein